MTPFAKKAAVKEAHDLLMKMIDKDTQFQSIVKKMWDKSKDTKYSAESQARIRSAFDSKGKALIPTIIRKVRAEALSGASRSEGVPRTKTLPRSGGSSRSTGNFKKVDSQNQNGTRKSTLDILNED
jgi:hypothetical protein